MCYKSTESQKSPSNDNRDIKIEKNHGAWTILMVKSGAEEW